MQTAKVLSTIAALIFTGAVGVAPAHAQNPPACRLWFTTPSQCEVTPMLSNNSVCTGSTPCTEEEEEQGQCTGGSKIPWVDYLKYNEVRYQNADDAVLVEQGETATQTRMKYLCRRYAELMITLPNPGYFNDWEVGDDVGAEVIDSDDGICLIDRDGDDKASSFADRANDVKLENTTADAHCFLTPQGPYRLIPGGGNTAGGKFNTGSESFKKSIFDEQWKQRGPFYFIGQHRLVTDAGTWRNPNWLPSPRGWDPYYELQNVLINDPDAVQFDHIIPAKDSKKCKCGTNSNSNLALVSRRLNGPAGMSNNARHPARKALMRQWAGLQ